MRQNADSFQWMWELVIELMREFIPDDDDTPVDMSVEVPLVWKWQSHWERTRVHRWR